MNKLLCFWLFSLSFFSIGQKEYRVEYKSEHLKRFIKNPECQFKDSVAAVNYISKLQSTAIEKGYLLASVDSISFRENLAVTHFHLGKRFESALLSLPEEEVDFVRRKTHFKEKFLTQVPFTPREIGATLKGIHRAYINNGYPFAKVSLDSVEIRDKKLTASVRIEKGPLYTWQKIHIKGDTAVGTKYMSSLLGISVGDPFNQQLLQSITSSIEQVPFIKETRKHELLFTKKGCELFVYVESVAISSFNGVLGLQPDPVSQRLSLTGELNLKLLNVLKRGELLNIKWQSIRDQTQSLNSRLNYPFLFGTSFGIDGTFDLYKRDTSFLELDGTAGVQYFLNKGNFVKAYYQALSSNVLSGGANTPLFSKLGSTQSNNYGLAFTSHRVDYIPNPSRGLRFDVSSSVGSRNSQASDSSEVLKSTTFRGALSVEWFIPLHRRHVLRLANATQFYVADEIFQNEVYRFGGLTSQRGFNEDELLATTLTTSTLEYRFLLDRNSHVFAFYDMTWYENNAGNYYNDAPFGFGVGFSFRTNLGVFSISYALGRQFNQAIQLNTSKVHFGYIAYF